ncbi:MAG: ATP-binding protein [Thermoproteota archaeon]|uniref:ATP-binding protein n=1 Tax=Candidatus Methanodesulfokora washburnensis TaxID=2478471 RepID=A0A520KJJ0_9CREN|nr:MAG: ATP-binding protein [Candidatus Methanodesulfokores washburnensis]TDA38455.1 MAG: ATP-binding protein [Candidatus Korarchaeota archaeon]
MLILLLMASWLVHQIAFKISYPPKLVRGVTMYFDPEPKTRREDLFNMENELKELSDGLKRGKLVVVTGLRRYGKTSLILTYLNEEKLDNIFLDCRLLPSGMVSMDSFLDLLEAELNRKSWAKRILSRVEGISISEIGIKLKKRDINSLVDVLHALEGKILVIDEAQELRRSKHRFDSIIAYAYDHLNLKIVLSGSQVGLLYRFLRVDDPEAPLYGRPFKEVRMRRLNDEEAMEFLRKGFEQAGINVEGPVLEEARRRFDGVIGWLTYFGFSMISRREPIDRIARRASKLAISELEHALRIYGPAESRYKEVLRIIATLEHARWAQIKRGVEARIGRIPNNTLSSILRNLVDSGFLEKVKEGYKIADPVLRSGILSYW